MRRKYKEINIFKLGLIGLGLTILASLVQSVQNFFNAYPILSSFIGYIMSSFVFILLTYLIFYFPCKYDSYFKKVRNITFLFNLGGAFTSYLDTKLPENFAYLSFIMLLSTVIYVLVNTFRYFRTIVVQAKKYKNLIKTESVHALLGVMHKERASEAIFITTSTFGPSSYTFAESEKRIKLIDGRELLNRLNRYGINNYYID